MNRTIQAQVLRAAFVAAGAFVLLVAAVSVSDRLQGGEQLDAVLPFLSVALATVVLVAVRAPMDRIVERLTHHREVTAYSALADAATRLRAGSLDVALPGLAQVLADGTGARRAVVWLAVGDRLVLAAAHPPDLRDPDGSPHGSPDDPADGPQDAVENLAVLLARPGAGHVVPVLDGSTLRAVLEIDKPEAPITTADRLLMQDVAHGAGLLLRAVALNAELADRVRTADQLAVELQDSRGRLSRAREVERRRLVSELSRATTGRLAALRAHVLAAREHLAGTGPDPGADRDPGQVSAALAGARTELDDLLDRFRVIARGVYPAVLRGQGPGAALEELAADLPRPVRLSGDLEARLPWEIEAGIYHITAAALTVLAAEVPDPDGPAQRELAVRLSLGDGRLGVLVEDDDPRISAADLRAALTDDAERIAALGGHLELVATADDDDPAVEPLLQLRAWLPDRLEPLVGTGAADAGPR